MLHDTAASAEDKNKAVTTDHAIQAVAAVAPDKAVQETLAVVVTVNRVVTEFNTM